jgi:peptidyl-prolyl cis-trans isomerase C
MVFLSRMQKFVLFSLVAALTAGSAFAQTTSARPAAPADPVIITAGDLQVRRAEFEAAVRSLPPEYQQYALGPGKRQFAQDFLRMKLLAAEGRAQGVDKSPEIQAQLDMMRDNLVANAVLQRVQSDITVGDDELRRAYEASKQEFEKATARHILIAFSGSPAAQPGKPELSDEQAKAKAEDILKQLRNGASFEELAKAESDDIGSGANGGSLGEFSRGQMVPEFEQAAFTTPVGQLSDVIRTQFGYHIVKVDARDTASFEEVRPNLERTERSKKIQAYLEELSNKVNPTFDPTYFGS